MQFTVNLEDETDVNLDQAVVSLKKAIEKILKNRFPTDPIKASIDANQKHGELVISCPICGDSKRNPRNKRGRIYFNSMLYNCYNGGCLEHPISVENFLDKFHAKDMLSNSELLLIRKYSNDVKISGNRIDLHIRHVNETEKYGIPRIDVLQHFRLKNIEQSVRGARYLEGRYQIFNDNRHFAYNDYHDNLYMLNLTQDREHVIGIQIRFGKELRPGMRFYSYNYTELKKRIYKEEIPDGDFKERMNKLSLIYNIYRVNWDHLIYVFESTIDSHYFKNSIATWGTNNMVYLPNGRYFYDNTKKDEAGYKLSKSMLDQGYYVFLWGKFLDDYPQYYSCKDLNDIVKQEKGKFKFDVLEKYFGKDPLDLIYI
jgi:hypothetical protein